MPNVKCHQVLNAEGYPLILVLARTSPPAPSSPSCILHRRISSEAAASSPAAQPAGRGGRAFCLVRKLSSAGRDPRARSTRVRMRPRRQRCPQPKICRGVVPLHRDTQQDQAAVCLRRRSFARLPSKQNPILLRKMAQGSLCLLRSHLPPTRRLTP